jgi:cytochrome P450
MSLPVASLDDDLLDPGFLVDPYPVYTRLRDQDPVHWSEAWGCWVLTRYEDVARVLREDGKRFSVKGRIQRSVSTLPTSMHEELAPIVDHFSVGLLHSDPPDHTRLRRLINDAFTPRNVEAMRPRVELLVVELLDAIEDLDRFDLLAEFAFPLPAMVVADVLGTPRDDREQLRVWADEISEFFGANRLDPQVARQGQQSLLEAREYLWQLASDRRREPKDDLISRMIESQERGDPISDGEILSTCMTFLVGGHETTTALITNAIVGLKRFPEQEALLRDDASAMPTAVEEFLRYESTNQRLMRIALEDVEIGGRSIVAGQQLMLLLGAADRDPAEFHEPDRIDVRRRPNRHVALAMGPHFCIGAPLARLEAQVAIAALLERFPRIDVAIEPDWVGQPMLRLLEALVVDVQRR